MLLRLQLIFIVFFGLIWAGCQSRPPEQTHLERKVRTKKRNAKILFIGNSYTYYNAMPKVFAKIALLNGKKVTVQTMARGGKKLSDYSRDESLKQLIYKEGFQWVVLQEQSITPFTNQAQMYTAIRTIDQWVKQRQGNTLLFLFWAKEYEKKLNVQLGKQAYYQRFKSQQAAQDSLTMIHKTIADKIQSEVAPVGVVWQHVNAQVHRLHLWQSDHSHPTKVGSYISAMVFYASIFNTLPIRHLATCPLNPIDLEQVEQIIRKEVFNRKEYWNDKE